MHVVDLSRSPGQDQTDADGEPDVQDGNHQRRRKRHVDGGPDDQRPLLQDEHHRPQDHGAAEGHDGEPAIMQGQGCIRRCLRT